MIDSLNTSSAIVLMLCESTHRLYLWKVNIGSGNALVHVQVSWCHMTPLTHWGRGKMNPISQTSFKCIYLNENLWISLKVSLNFAPKIRINIIPAWVQIMAWRRPGDKPLSEPVMVSLLTHYYLCVTRPQWVKTQVTNFSWVYFPIYSLYQTSC